MLIDQTTIRTHSKTYDLVVVGGGPAGLSLVSRLLGSGLAVLLLEAGSKRETHGGRADYSGFVVPGNGHPALDLYRTRALGGTSRIWGGRTIPFDRIDFESRPWVNASGWPVSYAEIERYYPPAFDICEAGETGTDLQCALPHRPSELIEGLDGIDVRTTFERFSRPTDFWKRFGPRIIADRNVHALKNATALRIGLSSSGKAVTAIDIDLDGIRARVVARAFVIAGGGLEVPRLLLASDDVCPFGVGNENGLVGRYYMSHFCATFGELTVAPNRPVAFDYERDAGGVYVRRRLWMTEATQRRHALLNVTFRTHLPEPADPRHRDSVLSAMFLAKSLVQREYAARFVERRVSASAYGQHLANVVEGAVPLARFAYGWTRDRILASRKLPSVVRGPIRGAFALEFHCEQSPCFSSRVRLGAERDRHGMRRLALDWNCNRSDIDALERAYKILGSRVEASRTGCLVADYSLLKGRMIEHGLSTGHHIGTTRMSDDPRTGVVDADCRVHGIGNLYVASSSVFPTSSQANPTLTIVALALRLADKLRVTLTRSESIALANGSEMRASAIVG